MKASAALAFVVVAPAVAFAPPAGADQYDFISALDDNGVYYSSISDMIDIGKSVCRTVRVGGDADAVQSAINGVDAAGFPSNVEHAVIIKAAAAYMCPDIAPAITAYENQPPTPAPPVDTPPEFSCANDYCE